jgi:hypothetical protein
MIKNAGFGLLHARRSHSVLHEIEKSGEHGGTDSCSDPVNSTTPQKRNAPALPSVGGMLASISTWATAIF